MSDLAPSAVPSGIRLHGAADVAFAALYAWLGFVVVPSRARAFEVALGVVVALLGAAGVALLIAPRRPFARWLALVAQGVLLTFAATVIALLVASAAYLRGVYGALGAGASLMCLVAVALVVELCALLPLFQLRLLRRDDVRRHFAPAPAPAAATENAA